MSNRSFLHETAGFVSWAKLSGLFLAALITITVAFANPSIAARYASMVVDGHTGKILYSRNGDATRYPASLTKIMTLYMLFDELEAGKLTLKSRLRVSKRAAGQAPSKLGLKPGSTIRVDHAILALVTKSANDVAVVVAENIAGTEANFARAMTEKARSIGMKKTVFRNASGLPNKGQVTTARDMITMANRLMFDHPDYYKYFDTKYFTYRKKRYRNHNGLLFSYKGTDGIKTGFTRASGFNLLANVKRGKKHLIGVVFGGKTAARRNTHMSHILNKSFPRASSRTTKPRRKTPQYKQNIPVASAPKFPEKAAREAVKPKITAVSPETVASLPSRPGPATGGAGGYHIQVGAYARKDDALERLKSIKTKAGDVIKGHEPIAIPHADSSRYLYRARFAGFSRRAADDTCHVLKKRAITCVVMAAD